jgi:putative nucleotidyltransferase with HDIG domain
MSEPTRADAWALLCEWTESDSLRKHALAVEASMRHYARIWDEDEERYAITGLVHDLDYERYPDLDYERYPDLETGHPRMGMAELERLGYPEDVIAAVAGHADYLGVPRETRMAKTLFAVDELSGFVTACALVRPTGIEGMKVKSVRKKLKTPAFAAKVDRGQIEEAIAELEVDEAEHIQRVIDALAGEADALGISAEQVSAEA